MKSAILVVAALGLFAVGAAQAFTYDNRTNQNSDGSARFRDPDSVTGKDGTIGNSKFSLKFSDGSGQSTQSGVDSRFVQSSNPAFSSPFNAPNNLDTALGNRHY